MAETNLIEPVTAETVTPVMATTTPTMRHVDMILNRPRLIWSRDRKEA